MSTAAPASLLPAGTTASRRTPQQAQPSARKIVEEALHLKSGHESWLAFMSLVRAEYPYCTMYGVRVEHGAIVSCENIQRSLVFGEEEAAPASRPDLFERKWQALEAFCSRMGSGRLVELKFHDARPMTARTAEGGRRFRRFKGGEGLAK